ncbi:MAG: DinB family protein [Actinobacteria bacterium]|nr:DinB family protein [Actinomycetota bacterium]
MKITFAEYLDSLVTSAKGLCDRAESVAYSGDGWNPTTVLGHIVDVDNEVWMARFELMLHAFTASEPPVQFSWWEPDSVATVERYFTYSLVQAQAALMNSRKRMVAFLSGLTEAERQAPAIHKTFGAVTIESMVRVILSHDDEHGKSFSE